MASLISDHQLIVVLQASASIGRIRLILGGKKHLGIDCVVVSS